jgi:hypothetical protein
MKQWMKMQYADETVGPGERIDGTAGGDGRLVMAQP